MPAKAGIHDFLSLLQQEKEVVDTGLRRHDRGGRSAGGSIITAAGIVRDGRIVTSPVFAELRCSCLKSPRNRRSQPTAARSVVMSRIAGVSRSGGYQFFCIDKEGGAWRTKA